MANIGEADVGPEVGTTSCIVIVDVDDDHELIIDLGAIFDGQENGKNVAEVDFGANSCAGRKELRDWPKWLGTIHLRIGADRTTDRLSKPANIEFVVNRRTLRVLNTDMLVERENIL